MTEYVHHAPRLNRGGPMTEDLATRIAQGTGAFTAMVGIMTWQEWAIAIGIVCTVLTTGTAIYRNIKQARAAERANRK